ncbi:PPR domain-containing protein/PPR_2 domain-containing protein/PPR_3 domain-containing protein [Cephalotus follicularis]|uniref:PPR domain-containing protein/PPR_2 domain-containing protein/PPR_3 domain-containing protein n=1 Tax=Cephalotus follicularis TaxID=3775 RepID=A0A1Q3BTZ1_CEPFO|nr:PPR domain-containing protein/PPR_2 domain-containing protein/PPR_3 domain-containing protein [Cephalotus follicularis]
MALLTLAGRLKKTQHPILLSLIHHQVTTHPPSLSSHKKHSLVLASYQTLNVPTQAPCHISTLRFFSTQTLNDPLEIFVPKSHTRDPQEMGLLQLLKRVAHSASEVEVMASLDDSGIKPSQDLIYSLIWALRDDWRLAFLAFKWGEKWGCCSDESVCNLMVSILGSHRKFNTAWCLIKDLNRSSMDVKRAMLIMVDRYAAANYPCKAIRTVHIMEKFRFRPDEEAFHALLHALCKYGNIEEAEEFMLVNKKLFPLETEGYNIILNGWCNIATDVFEAKRVWREMSKCCITPNATSYTHLISCFSKVGNLFDSLRLYDEMKKRGWVPGLEVYNSLVYVLTRENCHKEALKILDQMKATGLKPDSTTYNSMIRPLCEAKKLEEARSLLATMIGENLSPTIVTYHAFLEGAGFEGTFEVLHRMRVAGLGPNDDTFLLILGKFFKLGQPENAMKIWVEMKQYEVVPTSAHYMAMVEGLARCGRLINAKELYDEMIKNGFLDDPKLKKLLKLPKKNNKDKREQVRRVRRDKGGNLLNASNMKLRKGRKRPRKKKTSVEGSKS